MIPRGQGFLIATHLPRGEAMSEASTWCISDNSYLYTTHFPPDKTPIEITNISEHSISIPLPVNVN